jgi:sec-independent protein translocase protein TatC
MTASPDPQNVAEEEAPLIAHLIEMRDRLLRVVVAVLLIFLFIFYFANDFYNVVATPLLEIMPEGTSMISTKPAGTFFTPMKLALVLSIFAAMPYILYQMWGFIAPALYRHERRLVLPLLASSTLLFYAGMAFAYFVVFPLMFKFFLAVAPEGVAVMTDISEYLDFVLKIFFAFGVAFEVPIATILLIWTGMVTPQSLAAKRPYIIVGAFVVGMLLTPPDVISQTLLALPMWILFELGLWASRYFLPPQQEEEEAEGDLDSDEAMEQELDRYEAEEDALYGYQHDETETKPDP